MRNLTSGLSMLALAALASGCAGSSSAAVATESGEQAPEPTAGAEVTRPVPEPLALLPQATVAVSRVDVVALRASPYYPTLRGWLEEGAPFEGELEPAILALVGALERVEIGSVVSDSGRSFELGAAVLVGELGPDQLFGVLRQTAARDGQEARDGELAGYPALFAGPWVAVTVSPSLAVLGPARYVTEELLARPERPPVLDDPGYARLTESCGRGAALCFGARLDPGTRGALHSLEVLPRRAVDAAQAAGGRVSLADGIDAAARVELNDAEAAAEAAAVLEQQRASFAGSLAVRAAGAGPVLEGASVQADGTHLDVRVRASHDDVERLLGRVGVLVGLFLRAIASEHTAAQELGSSP